MQRCSLSTALLRLRAQNREARGWEDSVLQPATPPPGARGEALVGGAEGPCLPSRLPHARCLISPPLARIYCVFLLPIYSDCICAVTTNPPHGGEGRVPGPPAPLFSTLELYQIKSLLFVQFFTASPADCFLTDSSLRPPPIAEVGRAGSWPCLEPGYKHCNLTSFPEG